MPATATVRFLLVAAAIELATGVSLYAFPGDFRSTIYAPVLPYFPFLSAALLAGGLLLLLVVRYAPPAWLQRLLGIGAAGPLLFLARYIVQAGGYTGGTAYLFVILGILAATWVTEERLKSLRIDLYSLTLGMIHLGIALLMLTLPGIFRSPAFEPIRPFLLVTGLLSLVGAALLLIPAAHRRLPLWVRRLAGTMLPGILCYTFLITGAWTGVVMWAILLGGALLESAPPLDTLRWRGSAGEEPESDQRWAVETWQTLETWSWVLTLVVVVVTSFLAPAAAGQFLPRAILFVLLLGGYNILTGWLLPPLGTPRVRLNLHLLVVVLAVNILHVESSPIAHTLFPVLLAIPMISARSGGRRSGYAMLTFVLLTLVVISLLDMTHQGATVEALLAHLAVELVTLGATGALGVSAAAAQRRVFHQLETTTRNLVSSNEELQAVNEELQAQSEELAAQQEELVSQHRKLLEQSLVLASQRDELQESESRFRTSFENAPIGMAMLTLDMLIIRANRALGEMLGYTPAELAGRRIQSIAHPEEYPSDGSLYLSAISAGEIEGYQVERRLLHREGETVWVSLSVAAVRDGEGHPLYLLAQMVDVTERRRAEEQLRHLANYDSLTDLINRRRFQEEVEERLAELGDANQRGALLFLDFDQFKFVNDTLGHRAGDELLKSLARVLASTLGDRGSVARLGGDEFGILLPGADSVRAEEVATQVLSAVRSHMEVIGGQPVGMTVSIGIAFYPEHGQTVEELMLHADLAMYQAKESGRNRHRIYHSGDREMEMGSRLNWERRIREALAEDRFVLHFQPILDLQTGSANQYEALLRMVERDGTLISPRNFLGVAESYGLIHAIDRWVVRRAIRTIAEERRNGRRLSLGVNLSARAFSDPELLPLIQAELEENDVQAQALIFEITETAAVADMPLAQTFIETLTGLGCRFALDDFGAGFSSLLYLKRLPVSVLKIDGSFIQRLPAEPVDQKMVKAVVTLARELGMETVAEYVSCDETIALLRELGVDAAQGYHIGRPSPLQREGTGV